MPSRPKIVRRPLADIKSNYQNVHNHHHGIVKENLKHVKRKPLEPIEECLFNQSDLRFKRTPEKQGNLPLVLKEMKEFGSPSKFWDYLCDSANEERHPEYRRDMDVIKNSPLHFDARIRIFETTIQVTSGLKMHRETFHLALNLSDRYLSQRHDIESVKNPDLIAMGAVWIASKIEEYHAPKLIDFLNFNGGCDGVTDTTLMKMEADILFVLKMNLHPMTSIQWLGFYMQLIACEESKLKVMTPAKKSGYHHEHDSGFMDLSQGMDDDYFEQHKNTKHRGHLFSAPLIWKEDFVRLATVLDICLTDPRSMQYSYRHLAAAVLYHYMENEGMLNGVTGLDRTQLESTMYFVRPYFEAASQHNRGPISILTEENQCNMKSPEMIFNDASPSKNESFDQHNFQPLHPHFTEMINDAVKIKQALDEGENKENRSEVKKKVHKKTKRKLFGECSGLNN